MGNVWVLFLLFAHTNILLIKQATRTYTICITATMIPI